MEFWVVPNNAGLPTVSAEQIVAAGNGGFVGMGAAVRRDSQLSIPNSGITDVPFEFEDFDDLGFWDISNPTEMVIPVTNPQITRVQFSGTLHMTNTQGGQSGYRSLDFRSNNPTDANVRNQNRWPPNDNALQDFIRTYTGRPIAVSPGEIFTFECNQTGTGAVTLEDAIWCVTVLR